MLGALGVTAVGTLVVAGLLTPAVYTLLQGLLGEVPWPYSRVFDRVALLVAAVFLWVLRHSLVAATFADHWGELARARAWRRAALAALGTLAASLAALPLVVGGGALVWHPERTLLELLGQGLRYVPAALSIALIEESFFRLLLFDGLRRRWGDPRAALASSLLYALVHFVSPEKDYVYPGWSPAVGFGYLGALAGKFLEPGVGGGLVGLTLVGLTLCLALARSRSFALCVGLHAGWVLGAKLALKIARRAPGFEFPSGAGRRNYLATQPIAWLTIALVMLAVWWLYRPRSAERVWVSDLRPPS
jgi:membrane protease YdiL (CAAX protease family)